MKSRVWLDQAWSPGRKTPTRWVRGCSRLSYYISTSAQKKKEFEVCLEQTREQDARLAVLHTQPEVSLVDDHHVPVAMHENLLVVDPDLDVGVTVTVTGYRRVRCG